MAGGNNHWNREEDETFSFSFLGVFSAWQRTYTVLCLLTAPLSFNIISVGIAHWNLMNLLTMKIGASIYRHHINENVNSEDKKTIGLTFPREKRIISK